MTTSANVAERLVERAASDPSGLGLAALRRGRAWRASWSELDGRAGALAHALARAGLAPGERALVLSRPDVDWIVAIHAIWRAGAVPVLIDPGMGRASLLAACARVRPRAVVAGPRAQLAMQLFPRAFETVGLVVAIGHRIAPGARALERLERDAGGSLAPVARRGDDPAAILFTSGATGPPKGVLYTHANFGAQVAALRELYSIRPGEVDLACFAPFALFHAGLGLTSVLPDIDFSRPAACDPALVVRAIDEFAARQSFGSPAIWSRVVAWCEAKGRTLPLRRLMIAGAPVKPRLVARARALLVDGEVHTPYGATEALPVADADSRTIEATRKLAESGSGTFVGRAAPGIEIALARVDDGPLERWSDAAAVAVAPGGIGEICVRGPAVTRAYADDEPATALAKVDDGAGGFWHRMGDLGRFDEQGGLWFLGRKAHRLETARGMLCPVPLENVFDLHEHIERSALVGVGAPGAERPWLIVEARPDRLPRDKRLRAKLAGDILRTGAWFPPCAAVEGVLFKSELPVDPRHNAKIDRGALKRWAQDELA